jgi:hypothetical protein
MARPLVVSIPHRLGKDEAMHRFKAGLGSITPRFGTLVTVHEETWEGDRLTFRITALMQPVSGTIDVRHDHVLLEVQLPWLLAGLATSAQALIQREATLMLEKK